MVYLLVFQRDLVRKYVVNRIIGMYYVNKGDRAYHKHKMAYSIEYYNKGLTYFPSHYTAWFNLGNIYVAYEDYYSAVTAYQESIKYNPRYVMARMNLGIVEAEKLGNFDDAINQYDTILAIHNKAWAIPFLFSNKKTSKTNIGLAYYNRGLAYSDKALFLNDSERNEKNGLLLQAANSYENSRKILRKNSDVLYNLALTYQLMGNYRDAGLNYCRAIALTPMNYEAHYNLAILLRRLKHYKESVDELEKASLLISMKSDDSDRTNYVFGVLSDVSRLYSDYASNDMKQNLDIYNKDNQEVDTSEEKGKKHEDEDYIKFDTSSGKIVPSKDLDKKMLMNFKNCPSMTYFVNEGNNEF